MPRSIIAALVALSVGLAIGVVVMHGRLAPQVKAMAAERDALQHELDALKKKAEPAFARLARLEQDYQAQDTKIAELYEALDSAETRTITQEAAPERGPQADQAAALAPEFDRAEQGTTPEEQAAFREQRREFAVQMRDNIRGYLAGQIEATTDPETQERLQAFSEYTDYLFDLRQQLHEAESDEERETLWDQMRQAGMEARDLAREQQDYALRQLAQSQGIEDLAKQEAFVAQLRETLRSPFFRMESMMGRGAGGGPAPGLGWGGPRRGGGGRGGPGRSGRGGRR